MTHIITLKQLPILLQEHEQQKSFADTLDRIWCIMDVMVAETSSTLLERKERDYHHYQLIEAWSRLILPCIPEDHYLPPTLSDAGSKVFSYITSLWLWKNTGDVFDFDLHPITTNIKRAVVEDVKPLLDNLLKNDTNVDGWLVGEELDRLVTESKKSFSKTYATIVRRGIRRLLGMSNISVTIKRNGSVHVQIKGLKRMIMLACVQRIGLECDSIVEFGRDKFSIISNHRNCESLASLIPSDNELARLCSI